MISVLIPVYNYNVFPLVEVVHNQLSKVNIDFEIICINDASTKFVEDNQLINQLKDTSFYNLTVNIGRSKIRNLLVEKSKYDWLLFLDADVMPENSDFILNYVTCIRENSYKVYCGGIIYENEKPNHDKLLRWTYGKSREQICLEKRAKHPYQYFLGANFLINKSVFTSVKFNESIIKYGYEDVLFAEDVLRNFIKVQQINNSVFHLGLEENIVFLDKTKEALQNLQTFKSKNIVYGENIKILRTYKIIKYFGLSFLFSNLYKLFEVNLKSKYPSMFVFDIYKLSYYCFLSKK